MQCNLCDRREASRWMHRDSCRCRDDLLKKQDWIVASAHRGLDKNLSEFVGSYAYDSWCKALSRLLNGLRYDGQVWPGSFSRPTNCQQEGTAMARPDMGDMIA